MSVVCTITLFPIQFFFFPLLYTFALYYIHIRLSVRYNQLNLENNKKKINFSFEEIKKTYTILVVLLKSFKKHPSFARSLNLWFFLFIVLF